MHKVLRGSIRPPFPEGSQMIQFGMGCFWGAEKMFWEMAGVISTHVGYSGGHIPNPTYKKVCRGDTGHTEVVRVVYDPSRIRLQDLLKAFWEGHDPTRDRQNNGKGSQYKSVIHTYSDTQLQIAHQSKNIFQEILHKRGYGNITTEICSAQEFYYAEEYHQQYLAENPKDYCGRKHTGAKFDQNAL